MFLYNQTKEVLNQFSNDLDKNELKINEWKNKLIRSQEFETAANMRNLVEGIKVIKKVVQQYLDKEKT